MNENKEKKQTPGGAAARPKRRGRALAILVCAAFTILIAGGLFLRLGWKGDGLQLKNDSGEISALRGFTFSGLVREYHYDGAFTLRDGNLEQTPQFIENRAGGTASTVSRQPGIEWVVADEVRAAVESAAVKQQDGSMQSETDKLSMMMFIDLPEVGCLRFCAGTTKLSHPAPVVARGVDSGKYSASDYSYGGGAPNDLYQNFRMNFCKNPYDGKWYGIAATATDVLRPGIYRVDAGLTQAQANALPKDVSVDGQAVRAGTLAYGTLTPVATIAKGLDLQTGGRLSGQPGFLPGGAAGSGYLVYKTEGTFRLDIIDLATGETTDTRDFDTLPADDDVYYATDSLAENQIVFHTTGGAKGKNSDVVALIENGKIQASATRTQGRGMELDENLLLSADGSRMMVLTPQYGTVSYTPHGEETVWGQACAGFLLQVYRVGEPTTQTPLYVGSLCPAGEAVYVMDHLDFSVNNIANMVNMNRQIVLQSAGGFVPGRQSSYH